MIKVQITWSNGEIESYNIEEQAVSKISSPLGLGFNNKVYTVGDEGRFPLAHINLTHVRKVEFIKE